MEEPTCITSCLICESQFSPTNNGDGTDTRASISILKKILLPQNEADVQAEKQNSEAFRLFCPACTEILNEWHEIQDWFFKLLTRSKDIKYRLIVNILESNVSLPGQLRGAPALQELLEDFAACKRAVINEYRPSLRLERLAEIPLGALRNCSGNDGQDDTPADLMEMSLGFDHEDFHDDQEDPTFDAAQTNEFQSDDDVSDELNRESSSISTHVLVTRKWSPSVKCYGRTPKEKPSQETDTTSRRTRPKLRSQTSEVQILQETFNAHVVKSGPKKRSVVHLDNGDILYDGKYTVKFRGNKYLCPVCGLQRVRKCDLMEHIREEHIRGKANKSAPKKRSVVHLDNGDILYAGKYTVKFRDNKYLCPVCGLQRVRKCDLLEHIREEHISAEADEADPTKRTVVELDNGAFIYDGKYTVRFYGKTYLCPLCALQKKKRRDMTRHIRIDHILEGSKDPEIIRVGENSFLYLSQYGFTFSDNQYKCTTCGVALANRLHLIDHIQVCHVNGAEPSALAPETSAIENSQAEDTQLTPYVQFDDTSDEIQRRRPVVKLDNDHFLYDGKYTIKLCGKTYVCPVCGIQRPRRNAMTEHIRVDHIQAKGPTTPEVTAIGENFFLYLNQFGFSCSNDRYKCTTCGITFPKRNFLFDHIQVSHVNEAGKDIHVGTPQSVETIEEDPDRHQTEPSNSEAKSEQDRDDEEETGKQDSNNPPSGPSKPFKCVPISENVFMYAGKYRIVLKDGRYKCPKCSCTQRGKHAVMQHIRAKHMKNVVSRKVQPLDRIVTINENELMYAGHRFKKIKDRYFCSECSTSRPTTAFMTVHIRAEHMKKKEVSEATPESEGQSSKPKSMSHQMKKIGPNEYLCGGQVRISITDGVYTCGSCGIQKETLKLMHNHATYKHIRYDNDEFYKSIETLEDGTFKCGKCEYIGSNWRNIYYHIHAHKVSLKKTGSAELRKYIYSVEVSPNHFDHGGWPYRFVTETGLFNCGSCNATFPTQPKITRHISARHRKQVETLICEECGKAFGSKSLLSSHKIRQHSHPKNTVPCPECGKLFANEEDVTSHLKTHLGKASKKHVCEFCGNRFQKLNHLQKHRANHTGEAPYSCDDCGLGFWTQRDLKNHQTTQHPQETESNNVPVNTDGAVPAIDKADGVIADNSSM